MRNFTKSLCAAAAALPLMLAAVHASAQSIDYGSLEQLFGEPVTTSATGSPQRSTEVPVDMTIISADDIKRSGARDIPTLLSRVSGLDVLQWSSQSADVGVRGYNQAMSPRLLVLVNGRQVYLDHYGYTAWSTIPVQLSEIRQIEVVKGPNSALFGFNAVSGVVNIITFDPKYDTVNSVTARVGSNNSGEANIVSTLHILPKLSARISLGAAKQDEWNNDQALAAAAYRPNSARVNANIDAVASLTDKTQLRFETSLSNAEQTDMISSYNYTSAKYITSSVKLGLTSETRFGLVQASVYQNGMVSKSNLASQRSVFDNTITVYNVQDLFKVGAKHTFRLSFEHRHNEMPTGPVAGGEVSYDVDAVSGMWAWAISDRFSTDIALRSDGLTLSRSGTFAPGYPLANNSLWDRKISETSYNAGAVWRVSDNDTLRAMAAKGVQVPTLIELGGLQLNIPEPGYTLAYMGDPFIQPTIVTNAELSYDHNFGPAKMGVRIFDQKSENIVGQPTGSPLFQAPTMTTYPAVSWENVADSKMSGYEVSASGKLDAYHWSADYTGTDVKDTAFAGQTLTGRAAAYAITTPKARANASLGWSGGKWTIDGFYHYTSDFSLYSGSTIKTIKAYSTLAANVSYDMGKGMTLSLSGQNLSKAHQIQTTGLKVPSTIFLSLSKSW